MNIRSREQHIGSHWSQDDKGREIEGEMYRLTRSDEPWLDPKFVYDALRQRWWALEQPERREVTDAVELEALNAVREDDAKIVEEWRVFARQRSGGDEVLAEVIFVHLQYRNGKLEEPTVAEGIAFWVVGHNASHSFAAGCKDGTRYTRSSCYDEEREAEVVNVTTIPAGKGWGYLGHF